MINNQCPACDYHLSQPFTQRAKDFEGHAVLKKKFDVLRCQGCESLYLTPFPSMGDTKSFYPSDYMAKNRLDRLLHWMIHSWQKNEAHSFAKKWGRDSKILDFGSGNGSFVRLMREVGCLNAYGYEPMAVNAESNDLIFTHIDDIRKKGMKFDLIRMNDTIEHLVDLDETMKNLSSLLKEGGIILGITANGSHFSSKLMGKYWGFLHYPYHTIIFSPEGLKKAAMRWGFQSVQTGDSYVPSAWAFTIEHILKDLFRLKTRGHLAIYSLLLLLSIPFVFLDRLLPGHTSEFSFQLKK